MSSKTNKVAKFVDDGGNKKVISKPRQIKKSTSDARLRRAMIKIIVSLIEAMLVIGYTLHEMIVEGGCSEVPGGWCGVGVGIIMVFIAPIPTIIGTILATIGMHEIEKLKNRGVAIARWQTTCGAVAVLQIPIFVLICMIYIQL